MPIDRLGRAQQSLRNGLDARSNVKRHQPGKSKRGGAIERSVSSSVILRSFSVRLKQEISNLNLDNFSDQEFAVEKFVEMALSDELSINDHGDSDFRELVGRVVGIFSDGSARLDLLKALSVLVRS